MIHFIVNPTAGSDKGIRVWRELEPELQSHSLAYDVIFTQTPGQAAEETGRLVSEEDAPLIAVLGGDGTLQEVLDGINHKKAFAKTTVTCLPCGSGNDFCRGMKLTKNPAAFANALTAYEASGGASDKKSVLYRVVPLHYGCGQAMGVTQNFFVSGGIGYDASVTVEINRSPLKKTANRLHLSTLAYLFLGIRQIAAEKQAPAVITVDGKKLLRTDRLFFLSAHNLPYEGGGFPFAPHAKPEKKELALCIFHDMNKLQCTLALLLSLFGLHRLMKGVSLLTCSQVDVTSDTFRNVHTDGEALGYLHQVSFAAGEGKIRFLKALK